MDAVSDLQNPISKNARKKGASSEGTQKSMSYYKYKLEASIRKNRVLFD